MKNQKSIFISHAWGGISDEILKELTQTLEKENISFILDKRDLAYRESINHFMIELGKADMVIIILSNKYLKSEYCMFELIQIYKNENLRDRIFPIVLDEVKISSSADRLEFVKFWENQLIDLQNKVKELNSLSYIEGITEDLNLYAEIRNNIARLTGILRDINTLNVTIHVESDYRDLIQSIKKRISGEPAKEENKIYISSTKKDSPVFNSFNYKLVGGSALALLAVFITWKILSKPGDLVAEDMNRIESDTFSNLRPSHQIKPTTPGSSTEEDIRNTMDTSRIIQSMLNRMANSNQHSQQDRNEIYGEDTKYSGSKTASKDIRETHSAGTENPSQKLNSNAAKPNTTYQNPVVEKNIPAGEPKQNVLTSKEPTRENKSEESSKVINVPSNPDPPKTYKSEKSFTVGKGTGIVARSSVTISSDDNLSVPRRINFVLDQDIYDGRTVAIPAGSVIAGTLSSVKKSDQKRAGSITMFLDYLIAPDGQKIPLQKDEMYLVASGKVPYEIHPNNKIKVKTASSIQIKY